MLSVRFHQQLTMDPKGRLALPTRLWGRLDADGVRRLVFILYGSHLRGYTLAEFQKIEDRFGALDAFDPVEEERQRRVLGFATEVDLDDAGRFVLPAGLREMAGLARDLVMISMVDRLEIWDADRFKAWFQSGQGAGAAPGVSPAGAGRAG